MSTLDGKPTPITPNLVKPKQFTLHWNLVKSNKRSIAGSPCLNSLYAFPTPCVILQFQIEK